MSVQRNNKPLTVPGGPSDPESGEVRQQIEKILASETLAASVALRRLLKFLCEKTLLGEADDLKEYSVGLDGLGKPASYDPRQDAGVRLQAFRLRQKLDEYYRTEGSADPIIIELPKGQFKIAWHFSEPVPDIVAEPPSQDLALPLLLAPAPTEIRNWRRLAIGLAAVTLLLALSTSWALVRNAQASTTVSWGSPELEALWSPFFSSSHRLIVAYGVPLFIRLQSKGSPDVIYRRREITDWEAATKSPEFIQLSKSLGNSSAKPTFDFVSRSHLLATFALSQFFERHRKEISLEPLSDTSWEEFADNDVIVIAPRDGLNERQSEFPFRPAFLVEKQGIRNLQPAPGEPAFYVDAPEHITSDGETLELVSVMPGPLGRTRILSFTGNQAWGVYGGVQSLTDQASARGIAEKLKEPTGIIPPFYQIILRIRYRDGIPTKATYVTHHVIKPTLGSLSR